MLHAEKAFPNQVQAVSVYERPFFQFYYIDFFLRLERNAHGFMAFNALVKLWYFQYLQNFGVLLLLFSRKEKIDFDVIDFRNQVSEEWFGLQAAVNEDGVFPYDEERFVEMERKRFLFQIKRAAVAEDKPIR